MGRLEQVELHQFGPTLPRLVAGCMRYLNGAETAEIPALCRFIESALELGVDWFDHADIYGGYHIEKHFGRALKELGSHREQVKVITKCGIQMVADARPSTRIRHYDTSAEHIRRSIEASLHNFGVDQINLLLIHRPDPLFDAQGRRERANRIDRPPAKSSMLASQTSRPASLTCCNPLCRLHW